MNKILLLILLLAQSLSAQIEVPYTNNFDNPNSDQNWTHYAISGIDQWERGNLEPTDPDNLVWDTNLGAVPANNSIMVLESPAFNLTNANFPYCLSFKHKRSLNSGGMHFEYSLDNGVTWAIVNPTTTYKKNWQSSTGFGLTSTVYLTSAVDISFLQGNTNVKFRFKCTVNTINTSTDFGWVIDDFAITPPLTNINAANGQPIETTPLCTNFIVLTNFNFDNQYINPYTVLTHFYFSNDTVLDASDSLIGTSTDISVTTSIYNYTKTLPAPANLIAGQQYYIIHQHDVTNVVPEMNENDNIGYTPVNVRSILNLPYSTDFETDDSAWSISTTNNQAELKWERGMGTRHHLEGAYSGTHAWHTSKTINEETLSSNQSIVSPYFNLTSIQNPVLSFWYKKYFNSGVSYVKIQYSANCSNGWIDLQTVPYNLSDEWERLIVPLSAVSSNQNIRFRVYLALGPSQSEPGIVFDDFYLGPIKPDLSVELLYSNNRYTSSDSSSDYLKYQVRNSGSTMTQNSVVQFYWSTDNVYDGSDVYLGEQVVTALEGNNIGQWLNFNYNKPTQAAGNYFIIYKIDSDNLVDEIAENNNFGSIPIEQLSTFGFPYYNDFENNTTNWVHDATLGVDEWIHDVPQGGVLDAAFSGTKAWISKGNGPVTSMSRMHLYTPVFNLTNSQKPVLEFDMKLDNVGGCFCFELTLNLSYSTDNGATWTVLNPVNNSYSKWNKSKVYNENTGLDQDSNTAYYTHEMFSNYELVLTNQKVYNSMDVDRNTKYIIDITHLKNESNIRFRYNLSTQINDGTSPNLMAGEGALIDNFQIREADIDLNVPYSKNLYLSSLATKIRFSIDVKNSGNYISNATNIKFYLSNNTFFDGADYYLGSGSLPQIRPDFKKYSFMEFNLPNNVSDYAYLIYVIDDVNANIEYDETNNVGYWELGLNAVTAFPYYEDFEGDVINGWQGYAYSTFSGNTLTNYRVNNKIPVSNTNNMYLRNYNGVLRTEYVPYGSWQANLTPMYYIQSPTFDFTGYNSSEPLIMAFDIMSIGGNNVNGSNMQYSVDGGVTWTLLTTGSGPSFNWYQNFNVLSDFNQPGWTGQNGEIKSVKMNISFLQNQSNVIFRYRYFSNVASSSYDPRGFRLDNFSIGQETLVEDINCVENIPYSTSFSESDIVCWEFGSNDDEMILLDKDAGQNIHWETSANFANLDNNPSVKINMLGQGNTSGAWLISPRFNLVTGNKLRFVIALTQLEGLASTNLGGDDLIRLSYSTDNGLTWTNLMTWNNSSLISNTQQEVLINSLPENGYINFAFIATNGTTNNGLNSTFYVDDFQLYTGTLGLTTTQSFSVFCFPNPVEDTLTVVSESEPIDNVKIISVAGQLLYEANVNQKNFTLDFSSYAKGAYLVEFISSEKTKTVKILK